MGNLEQVVKIEKHDKFSKISRDLLQTKEKRRKEG